MFNKQGFVLIICTKNCKNVRKPTWCGCGVSRVVDLASGQLATSLRCYLDGVAIIFLNIYSNATASPFGMLVVSLYCLSLCFHLVHIGSSGLTHSRNGKTTSKWREITVCFELMDLRQFPLTPHIVRHDSEILYMALSSSNTPPRCARVLVIFYINSCSG